MVNGVLCNRVMSIYIRDILLWETPACVPVLEIVSVILFSICKFVLLNVTKHQISHSPNCGVIAYIFVINYISIFLSVFVCVHKWTAAVNRSWTFALAKSEYQDLIPAACTRLIIANNLFVIFSHDDDDDGDAFQLVIMQQPVTIKFIIIHMNTYICAIIMAFAHNER